MTTRSRSTRARLQTFERGGLVFDVIDDGPRDGTPIVFLHGFPGGSATWSGVATRLAGAGYRTLTPDQRGYSPGARPAPVSAYRIDELVLDIVALADRAELSRFHVVGHDWGGAVAWHLAGSYPDRLQTLTVLSTPHPRAMAESMTRSLQILRSSYALAWQVPFVPESTMLAGRGRLLSAALVRSGLPEELAEAYVHRMRQPGSLTAALNWYRAAGRSPRATATAPPTPVPTLYVWSTDDPALGRTAAELTARHVRGSYEFLVLEGLSHWIPETAPDRVAHLLLAHTRADRAEVT